MKTVYKQSHIDTIITCTNYFNWQVPKQSTSTTVSYVHSLIWVKSVLVASVTHGAIIRVWAIDLIYSYKHEWHNAISSALLWSTREWVRLWNCNMRCFNDKRMTDTWRKRQTWRCECDHNQQQCTQRCYFLNPSSTHELHCPGQFNSICYNFIHTTLLTDTMEDLLACRQYVHG